MTSSVAQDIRRAIKRLQDIERALPVEGAPTDAENMLANYTDAKAALEKLGEVAADGIIELAATALDHVGSHQTTIFDTRGQTPVLDREAIREAIRETIIDALWYGDVQAEALETGMEAA